MKIVGFGFYLNLLFSTIKKPKKDVSENLNFADE
jgi:hypothetical protein